MLPRKTVILMFLSLFLITLSAVEADACSCAGPRYIKNFQPCGIYWSYDVIFIGLAEKVSIERVGTDEKTGYSKKVVQFSVDKAIRGVEGKTVEVETGLDGAICGYPFRQGERYFVYLQRGKDGKLVEWLCGATVLLKDAAADLEYLQAVENGEKGGRVFGNVSQFVRKSFKDRGEHLPLAGTKISLTSVRAESYAGRKTPKYVEREFQTKTDEKGFYLFKEIPEGSYKVKAEFQKRLPELYMKKDFTERYISIDEDKRHCGGHNFIVDSQGSIEGRIVGSDGQKPPPQQFLSLIPIDENGKIYVNQPTAGVWTNRENGRYFFKSVPPGKYLLAINPRNCPSREKSAFGKMFFPGVGSETESEIISVAENEQKKTADFQLLPPLKERIFSGVVLSADKMPISGAKVFMIDRNTNKCMNLGGLGETKTDESGRFQLKGYESYEYKIRAYTEKNSSRLYSELIDIPADGNFENLELIVSKPY